MPKYNLMNVLVCVAVCRGGELLFPEWGPSLRAVIALAVGAESLRYLSARRGYGYCGRQGSLSKTEPGRLALVLMAAASFMVFNLLLTWELERWYCAGVSLLCSGLLLTGVHHAFVARRDLAFTLFTVLFGLSLVAIIVCGGLFW